MGLVVLPATPVELATALKPSTAIHAFQGEAAADPARTAADTWLALTDAGDAGAAWDTAAAYFRGAVMRDDWQAKLTAVRRPLGAVKSRVIKSVTRARTLPGAPDGDYAVLQFDTSFEHKQAAIETLTVVAEPDGVWRVVGYFVR
jgi:hypothetical protein